MHAASVVFLSKTLWFQVIMKKKIKEKIQSHSTKHMTQIFDLQKYQGCKGKKITDWIGED